MHRGPQDFDEAEMKGYKIFMSEMARREAIQDRIAREKGDRINIRGDRPRDKRQAPRGGAPRTDGCINTIAGGPSPAGASASAQKRSAREVRQDPSVFSVAQSGRPHPSIVFSAGDAAGVHFPHADPLIIHVQVGSKIIKRVLVDTGASVDLMYWDTFEQLGIGRGTLRPFDGRLVGFSSKEIDVEGTIELNLTMSDGDKWRTEPVEFTVVRLPST